MATLHLSIVLWRIIQIWKKNSSEWLLHNTINTGNSCWLLWVDKNRVKSLVIRRKKTFTKIMSVAENNMIQISHLLNIHVEVTTFVISVTLFCLHKQWYTLRTLFHKWSRYDQNNRNVIKTYILIFLDYFLQKTYLLLQGHYSLTSIIRPTKLHACKCRQEVAI